MKKGGGTKRLQKIKANSYIFSTSNLVVTMTQLNLNLYLSVYIDHIDRSKSF